MKQLIIVAFLPFPDIVTVSEVHCTSVTVIVLTSYRVRSIVSARRRPTRRVDPGVQLDRSLLFQRRQYQREEHGQAHEDGGQHDLRRAKLGFDL